MTTRRQLLKIKVSTLSLQGLHVHRFHVVGHVGGESRKDQGNRVYALRNALIVPPTQEAAHKITVTNLSLKCDLGTYSCTGFFVRDRG